MVGPAGTATWRYDSPGLVDRPAQGPDGTIYVLEHVGDYLYYPNDPGTAIPGERAVVILDGATGAVTARVPLENTSASEPVTVGPIVGGDGFGFLLVTNGLRLTLHRPSCAGAVAAEVIVPATSAPATRRFRRVPVLTVPSAPPHTAGGRSPRERLTGVYNRNVSRSREALVSALAGEPDVRLAVLFGSEARLEGGAASDLDVGVLTQGPGPLAALAVRLERATGRRVDVVDLATAPPLLRFEMARDGQVLVERQPHLWNDMKARALVDWWDWAPIARRLHATAAARLRAQVGHGPS